MPKLRKHPTYDFTVMSNKMYRDQNLKAIDRGLLGTMLSLADGWDFSIKGLAKILPDGESAIAHSLKRIENAHYLFRKRNYKNGVIVGWDYIISDEPMDELYAEEEKRKADKASKSKKNESAENSPVFLPNLDVDSLDVENHDVDNQDVENQHDNIITNNKTSKNKESIDKISINPSSDGVSRNFRSPKSFNDKNDRLKNKLSEQRDDIELLIKSNIEYDWYQDFFDETPDNSVNKGNGTFAGSIAEIDMLVGIIVDSICSEKQYIRIGKEDMPRSVVESRFKKLEMKHIEYALKCLMLNTKEIRNPVAYLTTVLYNASFTCDFAENNELKNSDPALFIPQQFHNEEFKDKYYDNSVFRPAKH